MPIAYPDNLAFVAQIYPVHRPDRRLLVLALTRQSKVFFLSGVGEYKTFGE
jgi:hypothetical protein